MGTLLVNAPNDGGADLSILYKMEGDESRIAPRHGAQFSILVLTRPLIPMSTIMIKRRRKSNHKVVWSLYSDPAQPPEVR
jgi:hypothetical protein